MMSTSVDLDKLQTFSFRFNIFCMFCTNSSTGNNSDLFWCNSVL